MDEPLKFELLCPRCGADIQEIATRDTYQAMTVEFSLDASAEDIYSDVDWGEFDYGDDVKPESYQCTQAWDGCGGRWLEFADLIAEIKTKYQVPADG